MSALDIDLLAYLRLEVEDEATGLVNLVANPSGELGGWGWVTPVAGSVMSSEIVGAQPMLRFTAPTPSAASHFYTEAAAVAAGQYVAASWRMPSASAAGIAYRAKFEYLDASGAVIGSSAQTGYLVANASTVAVGPFLAPASTAYARLRFDMYLDSGGSYVNPTAGSWLRLYQVTVAKAATSAALGTLRTNLATNPSFETNTTGWTAANSVAARVTAVTTAPYVGEACLRLTASASGGVGAWHSIAVTAGKQYAFSAYSKAATTGRQFRLTADWYGGGGTLLLSQAGALVATNAGGWTRAELLATAPVGATSVRLWVIAEATAAAGEQHYFDGLLVEQLTSVGAYFDGATPDAGGVDYAWTGTAHASTSTATSSNLAYVEPVPFVNILSGSASLEINRAALDVGVIQALIKDASLDPATADTIRPGRAVRVRALNDTTGAWDVLATGTLDKARVSYDLRKPLAKQASITLATTDANQVLANTNRPDGVAAIADLPFVLEGARVPWNVDGSGDQVPTATVASSNDQANALDQVILARDSSLGYAWVTKEGVLTAYTDRTLDFYGIGTPTLDESVYSGLDVTFDPEDCINEVMVNYRRFNAATGQVDEVPFGPYRDTASIDEWGVHQKTFTVHGIGEANVPAYAADILAANAQPARRINSVRIPIRSAADLVRTKALLDLYAKVRITNTDKALDQTLRVTGIKHLVSPRRWTMLLTFDQVDTVAGPRPTTPQGGGGVAEGVWYAATPTNSWTNYGSGFNDAAYMRKNGIVYLRGLLKTGNNAQAMFTLPEGFRPSGTTNIFPAVFAVKRSGAASAGTAHTHDTAEIAGRVNVTSAGAVVPIGVVGVGTWWVSVDGISFPAEA